MSAFLIKYPFNYFLFQVVLPTFVLEKRSLLEMYADFLGHTDLFTKISEQKNAEERMLAVLEFYLTSFHVGRKVHKMDSLENLVISFF